MAGILLSITVVWAESLFSQPVLRMRSRLRVFASVKQENFASTFATAQKEICYRILGSSPRAQALPAGLLAASVERTRDGSIAARKETP
jgi:hypothetical protein